MYSLQRFHGPRFDRVNAILDNLSGHITSYVNLVGSASLPFPEVCAMQGSPGTGCRVEGHRRARLFPATGPIDQAEILIEERTRQLFGLDSSYCVSGQPHSATQANHAVIHAVLGGRRASGVSALLPSDGGHISHRLGLPLGTSFFPIPLQESGINYDMLETEVDLHRPSLIIAGGTSYTRKIDYARLRDIADRVGAHLHADLAHIAPFVATGHHPPAFPHADSATLDTSKNLRGPRGGILIYRKQQSARMRRAIFPVLQSAPNQNGILAKACCLASWTKSELADYAMRMVHMARILSRQMEEVCGPPVFRGTDTHLLLLDLSSLGVEGRRAEDLCAAAQVLVNRNQIPGDKKSPWIASGIRLSTTCLAILQYRDEDVQALGVALGSILRCEREHDQTIARLIDTYHRRIINTANAPTSLDTIHRHSKQKQ